MRALRRNGASTTPYRARGLSTCQQREWERHLGRTGCRRVRLGRGLCQVTRPRGGRKPRFALGQFEHTPVIGTIQGDVHDIGKNLVGMLWKGANIDVIDLGTNVPPSRFADAAKEHHAQIVGISALLTTTMVGMRD